jgi:hypothetical protein
MKPCARPATGCRFVAQERVGARSPEALLARLFVGSGVDYVHVRNAEAGCFMARVEGHAAP